MSEQELKPCPFCGFAGHNVRAAEVICQNSKCIAEGPHDPNYDFMVAESKWNTRPIEDQLRAEIAVLRESRDAWRRLANTWCYAYESPSSFYNDGDAEPRAYRDMAELEQKESEAGDGE